MTGKPGTTLNRQALAQAIAQQLVQAWDRHLADRTDGYKIVIHVQPGQDGAKIEWPQPVPDEIKLNRPR